MHLRIFKRLFTSSKKAVCYNGSILRNDCVFVSIAHLLGMSSVEQLYRKINWTAPTDPAGISWDEIHEVLAALEFRVVFEDYNAIPLRPVRALNMHPPHNAQPACFGVIYRRKDGSEHCVVQERKYSYNYIDYQHSPEGVSVWEDVRESYIHARF